MVRFEIRFGYCDDMTPDWMSGRYDTWDNACLGTWVNAQGYLMATVKTADESLPRHAFHCLTTDIYVKDPPSRTIRIGTSACIFDVILNRMRKHSASEPNHVLGTDNWTYFRCLANIFCPSILSKALQHNIANRHS